MASVYRVVQVHCFASHLLSGKLIKYHILSAWIYSIRQSRVLLIHLSNSWDSASIICRRYTDKRQLHLILNLSRFMINVLSGMTLLICTKSTTDRGAESGEDNRWLSCLLWLIKIILELFLATHQPYISSLLSRNRFCSPSDLSSPLVLLHRLSLLILHLWPVICFLVMDFTMF